MIGAPKQLERRDNRREEAETGPGNLPKARGEGGNQQGQYFARIKRAIGDIVVPAFMPECGGRQYEIRSAAITRIAGGGVSLATSGH